MDVLSIFGIGHLLLNRRLIFIVGFFFISLNLKGQVLSDSANSVVVDTLSKKHSIVLLNIDLKNKPIGQLDSLELGEMMQYQSIGNLNLPPIPLGFFCKFENRLHKKKIPIDFGTD